MTIQFQRHPANSSVAHLKNFHVCFHQFLLITKTFRGSRLLKYLINIELIWLSATKYKPKLFHGLTCHFMLDRLHWCTKQRNRTNVFLGELRYIYILYIYYIYIYIYIQISPSSINLHIIAFNILLVLALNFRLHKSSYCKYSLAWWEPFFYFQSQHIPSKWDHSRSRYFFRITVQYCTYQLSPATVF